jgi:hypothetical protein
MCHTRTVPMAMSTNGNEYAASTTPTSAGLPVSRVTYSAMATITSASPITLADWLSQRRRKLRDRSAEKHTGDGKRAVSRFSRSGWLDDVGNQGSGLARRRLPRQLHPPTAPPTRRVAVHHDAHDG